MNVSGELAMRRLGLLPTITFIRLGENKVPQWSLPEPLHVVELIVRLPKDDDPMYFVDQLWRAEIEFYQRLFEVDPSNPGVLHVHDGMVWFTGLFWTVEYDTRPNSLRPNIFRAQVSYTMAKAVNNIREVKMMTSLREFKTWEVPI